MFCRIEVLRRTVVAPNKRVAFRGYISRETQAEVEERALAECQTRKADGFRIYDLHTRNTKVRWVSANQI